MPSRSWTSARCRAPAILIPSTTQVTPAKIATRPEARASEEFWTWAIGMNRTQPTSTNKAGNQSARIIPTMCRSGSKRDTFPCCTRRLPMRSRPRIAWCLNPRRSLDSLSGGSAREARQIGSGDSGIPFLVFYEEALMKRSVLFLLFSLALPFFVLGQQQSIPEIPYDSTPNLLQLPADLYLGEVAGVAVNSKGHIFVFTRRAQTPLFELAPTGKFVREIGKDFYGFSFAHVVRIDKDDNIWCVDEVSHIAIELIPNARQSMLFIRTPDALQVSSPLPS